MRATSLYKYRGVHTSTNSYYYFQRERDSSLTPTLDSRGRLHSEIIHTFNVRWGVNWRLAAAIVDIIR
jgi:hypothetical protein